MLILRLEIVQVVSWLSCHIINKTLLYLGFEVVVVATENAVILGLLAVKSTHVLKETFTHL